MKINGYQPVNKINPYKQSLEKKPTPQSKSSKDQVEISDQAKQLQASATAASSNDRAEKVAKLKQQIDNGSYQVNPQAVAKKFYEFWRQ